MAQTLTYWECTEDDCDYRKYIAASNAGMEALDHLRQEHGIGTLEQTEADSEA